MKCHISCSSKIYCESDGKEGNVDKVFFEAIKAHLDRKLSLETKKPCDCAQKREEESIKQSKP